MTAIALDGLARVSQGEIAAGMARLDEATTAATAGEMRDPIAIGFSCCYLIFACERVRDFERAGQWCERVARMAEGWNIRALRSVCRAHYGAVLMLRGDWAAAEVVLSEAAAAQAARPAEAIDALARLAELRRRQGRTDQALALIEQAEHHPIAVLSRGGIALERGDPIAAAELATRHLRLTGDARTERAAGLELLAEAHAAAGQAAEAHAAAVELLAIARGIGTDSLLGPARHAGGDRQPRRGARGVRGRRPAARPRRAAVRGRPSAGRARGDAARRRTRRRRPPRARARARAVRRAGR